MKITIEPTNEMLEIARAAFEIGETFLPTRVWKGIAENGVECRVLVMAIQPLTGDAQKIAEIVLDQGAPLMPVPDD